MAKVLHEFYERAGFKRISKEELPFEYDYPDRNSYLYLLEVEEIDNREKSNEPKSE